MGGHNRQNIEIGTIFITNNDGDVVSISERSGNSIQVKFTETGFIATVLVGNLIKGKVKDWSKTYKSYLNKTFQSNTCGEFTVVETENNGKIKVVFTETGYETYVSAGNLKAGRIKDPFYPICAGIGFSGVGPFCKTEHPKQWKHWYGMLSRCYTDKRCLGGSVNDVWHNFQNFAAWCQTQKGSTNIGWELDKDLFGNGDRQYSAESCCFLPSPINSFISQIINISKIVPLEGETIRFRYRDVSGTIVENKLKTHNYKQVLEKYTEAKEATIKNMAEKYIDMLDSRVYDKLMNLKF